MTLIRRKEFGEITVEFYGEGRPSLGVTCEEYKTARQLRGSQACLNFTHTH
jgi:hypothetical protein